MNMDIAYPALASAAVADNPLGSEGRALSQNALTRIAADHERYLARRNGRRARLANARLDRLDLAGRDLSEADFSGASLKGANLSGANLSRASLYCADLSGCDLRGARLDHADLRGAAFRQANLSHAVMDHADLRAAAVLHLDGMPKFRGNEHDEAPFGAVDFSGAALRRVSFRHAKLDNANFTDALLEDASFHGARMRNACFRDAIVSGAEALASNTIRHVLPAPNAATRERAKLIFSALLAHHEWFTSNGKRGQPAAIDYEDLRPLGDALRGLCLAGLSARRSIAVGVDFSGCQLQAAKFDGADLRAAGFNAADLSGTSLRRAKLAHATFKDAAIRDLILCTGQAVYFRADTDAGLKAQLGEAHIQPNTLFAVLGEQQGSC
jgi:uncharacterized protein YjbI with pentapeptide repeats